MRPRFCLRTPIICCLLESPRVHLRLLTPTSKHGSPIDTSAEVEEPCFPIYQKPTITTSSATLELGAFAMTSLSFPLESIASRCISPIHGSASTIGGTVDPAAGYSTSPAMGK